MSRATTWSADEYTFMLGGLPIESGRGESEFLSIAQQAQDFDYKASTDGEGTFYQDKNTYTIITMTLTQTAAGNAVLAALHEASKAAGGLPLPVFGEDRKGTSKLVSEAAMILKPADETIAKEPGTKVWLIGVHQPKRLVGGR